MDINNSNKKSYFSQQPKVLLVEDTITIQIVNQYLLQELGCHTDIANDGLEAIQMPYQDYDLIFMDLMMPNMDGFVATQKIRNQIKNKYSIIIALTTNDEHQQYCLEHGFDDFYLKPLDKLGFKKVLEKWLPHLVQNSQSEVQQTET